MDSTSELNSAFLYSHIAFLQKYIFLIILALFANFEVKPGQIGSKKQKNTFCKCGGRSRASIFEL
jgi:hypothetical protein